MTPLESLLLELIPQRLPPAPETHDGPTAQWLTEHPDQPANRHLKAVGE